MKNEELGIFFCRVTDWVLSPFFPETPSLSLQEKRGQEEKNYKKRILVVWFLIIQRNSEQKPITRVVLEIEYYTYDERL